MKSRVTIGKKTHFFAALQGLAESGLWEDEGADAKGDQGMQASAKALFSDQTSLTKIGRMESSKFAALVVPDDKGETARGSTIARMNDFITIANLPAFSKKKGDNDYYYSEIIFDEPSAEKGKNDINFDREGGEGDIQDSVEVTIKFGWRGWYNPLRPRYENVAKYKIDSDGQHGSINFERDAPTYDQLKPLLEQAKKDGFKTFRVRDGHPYAGLLRQACEELKMNLYVGNSRVVKGEDAPPAPAAAAAQPPGVLVPAR